MGEKDDHFWNWAINHVVKWRSRDLPDNVVHVHGTHDRLLPIPGNVDYIIENGGHYMVMNRGAEISEILRRERDKRVPRQS